MCEHLSSLNYNAKKANRFFYDKTFIMANLCKWESLRQIETGIRSSKNFGNGINLMSISHSQISRRLIDLDTRDLAELLGHFASHYWLLQSNAIGFCKSSSEKRRRVKVNRKYRSPYDMERISSLLAQ